ncbi:uncharacterized protein LOC123505223 isoform X2 [Portunus trituberculatus]|nr:uncharacterized protein LOC123505223 isoform X2 [Portunus trituberculatus]
MRRRGCPSSPSFASPKSTSSLCSGRPHVNMHLPATANLHQIMGGSAGGRSSKAARPNPTAGKNDRRLYEASGYAVYILAVWGCLAGDNTEFLSFSVLERFLPLPCWEGGCLALRLRRFGDPIRIIAGPRCAFVIGSEVGDAPTYCPFIVWFRRICVFYQPFINLTPLGNSSS